MFLKRFLVRFTVLSLAVTLSLSGCKLKREVTGEISPSMMRPDVLMKNIENNKLAFDWFSARFTGSVLWEDGNQNVSGTMRIERDKAIYISIAPVLGIEVARALVTPDSVKIVNRLDGTYYLGGMGVLNKMLNADLDFYMLQALFTGNDFPHFQKDRFIVSEENGFLRLSNSSRKKISGQGAAYNHSMLIDPETMKIRTSILTEDRQKRSLRADYKKYDMVNQQLVPVDFQLYFSDAANTANMNLTYNRITINEPQRIQFSIPARYKPLEFD